MLGSELIKVITQSTQLLMKLQSLIILGAQLLVCTLQPAQQQPQQQQQQQQQRRQTGWPPSSWVSYGAYGWMCMHMVTLCACGCQFVKQVSLTLTWIPSRQAPAYPYQPAQSAGHLPCALPHTHGAAPAVVDGAAAAKFQHAFWSLWWWAAGAAHAHPDCALTIMLTCDPSSCPVCLPCDRQALHSALWEMKNNK
jgi:hypothetical protein